MARMSAAVVVVVVVGESSAWMRARWSFFEALLALRRRGLAGSGVGGGAVEG